MRTKQKLKLHKETHGVAKYACDICGKSVFVENLQSIMARKGHT